MVLVEAGSSIECLSAEIHARKFIPKIVVNIPKIGRCYKYSCDRNSDAVIMQELNPKKALYNNNSALNIKDSIEGEGIFFLVNTIRRLFICVSPYTGRHKSQYTSTTDYTYAEITKPFPNLGNLINPRNIPLLDIKQ